MAVNTYTTSDLITLVKLLGHVPQSQSTFTPTDILTLADFELRTAIAAQLKQVDEGYWQVATEYDQDSSGQYSMPGDAVASSTYVLQIRNGQAIWPVSRQAVSEQTTTDYPSVANYAFFIRSNTINVLPAAFDGVLRITYERRPSKLVTVTSCAQVSSIVGQVITVSSVPSGWVIDDDLDLQAAQPQFDILGSVTISNISGTDITVTGDISTLSVGDFLCLSGQTCVPQIPVEFHQLLAQRVVCKIYELQGYMDKLKAAKSILGEMETALTALITPRTQAAPKVINPSWGGRKPGSSWARFNPPAGASNT